MDTMAPKPYKQLTETKYRDQLTPWQHGGVNLLFFATKICFVLEK